MIHFFPLLVALAAPLPGPTAAQAAASTTVEAPATAATAAALARTVAPAELMISLEVEVARKAILSLPTLDADAKALEVKYPGIWQAVWNAVEPKMRQSVETDFPSFWSRLEEIYLSRLTENEAQGILAFYRSSTGQKMLRATLTGFDAAPLIADLVKSEDSTITAEQMESAARRARLKGLQTIGPADEEQFTRLTKSVSLDKFRAIGAETQKLTAEWVNKDDPEGEAELQTLMEAAMEEHMSNRAARQ